MNTTSAICLGIVSGLVSTLIIVFFRLVWMKIIFPWFENTLYHDTKIEGKWHAKACFLQYTEDKGDDGKPHYKVSKPVEYVVELFRTGHNVTGTMMATTGADNGITYFLKGSFRNLILNATFERKDRTAIDRGAMALMLVKNGEAWQGYRTDYIDYEHCMGSVRFELERHK